MWSDNEDCKYNCAGTCVYPVRSQFEVCCQDTCPIVHPELIDIEAVELLDRE